MDNLLIQMESMYNNDFYYIEVIDVYNIKIYKM